MKLKGRKLPGGAYAVDLKPDKGLTLINIAVEPTKAGAYDTALETFNNLAQKCQERMIRAQAKADKRWAKRMSEQEAEDARDEAMKAEADMWAEVERRGCLR